MSEPAITVVGGGAIGGITAAYLARKGFSRVVVVDTWAEHVAAMRRGLQVEGCRGVFTVPLNAVTPAELSEPLDLVLLAVKSVDTEAAVKGLLPLLTERSTVVSLQNSINEERIAALVGRERTVGCMIGWGATSEGPGRLIQTSPGEFVVGGLNGETEGRIAAVRETLEAVTECQATANIYGFLWTKLIVNCVIALGALQGKTVGETVAMTEAHPVITAIVGEGLQVAARLGIVLETANLRFEPEQYLSLQDFIAETIIQLLESGHGDILPSIYQDILKGRPSEIDHINGYIVSQGTAAGVPTPLNESLVMMVHQIETGQRPAGPENIRILGEKNFS